MERYFTPVPDVTQPELTPWESAFYRAVKQNMDLLTGSNSANHTAVLRGDIITEYPPDVLSTGEYVNISGTDVPTAKEHLALRTDVLVLRSLVADLLSRLKVT